MQGLTFSAEKCVVCVSKAERRREGIRDDDVKKTKAD